MRPRCCHYCGQSLPESRLGVRLAPFEGRIFDYIVTAGAGGIANGDLHELTTDGKRQRHTLNVHIYNINEKISETGYQIIGREIRKLAKVGKRYHASDALSEADQKAFGL